MVATGFPVLPMYCSDCAIDIEDETYADGVFAIELLGINLDYGRGTIPITRAWRTGASISTSSLSYCRTAVSFHHGNRRGIDEGTFELDARDGIAFSSH